MTQAQQLGAPADSLGGRYVPTAVYFMDSDCVEYVKEDAFCIYERVDGFLTLIFDETRLNLVGFKLKGFKHIFEQRLRPLFELHDKQFIDLVSVIEAVVTDVGNRIFFNDGEERAAAYKAAWKLAANDDVKLWSAYINRASAAA